jgi:hypothetical protein
VFTNVRPRQPFTVNGMAHVFRRAVVRAGITSGDVTPHVLRHTALSRMIEQGIDDHTVMEICGHSSTRMLQRYTHPTTQRKLDALTAAGDWLDFGRNVGRTETLPSFLKWWTAGGSNSRPPRCERGALPAELAAHESDLPAVGSDPDDQRDLAV